MRLVMLGIISALLISSTLVSCGSKGGGTPEAALVIATTPQNGATEAIAPGPDFSLAVTVTSTMPPNGVTIVVSASVDGSSSPAFFSAKQSTSTATTNFTITSTPAQEVCVVTVTVTSNTKATNSATSTYRYSMK